MWASVLGFGDGKLSWEWNVFGAAPGREQLPRNRFWKGYLVATDKVMGDPCVSPAGLQNARLVFILGIAERSGTTYLQDLLRLHPDCDVDGMELEEDHFVDFSDLLIKFVRSASRGWKAWWGEEQLQPERELVFRCLGEGLISYLKMQVVNRRVLNGMHPLGKELKLLVTKSPSTNNLELFFRLFPEAELIILIRDGRSVVESAVRTFFRRFDKASRQWADRADSVLRFVGNDANRDRRYLLVKYEDLYGNSDQEIGRILSFLRLDVTSYSFERARNLPVRGSSTLRREGAPPTTSAARGVAPGIHWQPVPKSADFNPLARWSHWKRAQHERFNWIAGDYLTALGYEKKVYLTNRWFWITWNYLLDWLPIESSVGLCQKIGRELKANPSKLGALQKLASKAWGVIKSSAPARGTGGFA
jgi:protein-tyrosine sulfotransferase